MSPERPLRVGYLTKVYPRYSETFVVTEVLAHERAGTAVRLYSLRPAVEGRFHADHADVRAPVAYVPRTGQRADDLWAAMEAARDLPGFAAGLDAARGALGRDVLQALLVARDAHDRGLELLHAHFASSAAVVARLAAAFAGLPYTVTAHAKDIFHEDVDPGRLRRVLEDAAAAVTVSDHNVRVLAARAPRARVRRIHNGLRLDRFARAPDGGRGREVVAVGRLVAKKGFADLLDAMALLRDAGTAVPLTLIGAGELGVELAARRDALGLGDLVRLTGPLPQHDVRRLVAGAAVLVAPCVVAEDGNRDGLPTVVLEAMALGTPVVATPVTGIPEAIVDGRTGVLVGEGDPVAIAAAVRRLLEDPGERARLADGARAVVEDRFDTDRNASALRTLWRTVLADAEPEEVERADRVRVR